MQTQSRDTDAGTEAVQVDLLRKSTIARRASIAISLSETAIRLARRAIRLQNANLTDREVLLRFVAVHYGRELAEKIDAEYKRRSG
jgi:hypothetical protein